MVPLGVHRVHVHPQCFGEVDSKNYRIGSRLELEGSGKLSKISLCTPQYLTHRTIPVLCPDVYLESLIGYDKDLYNRRDGGSCSKLNLQNSCHN